MISRIYWRVVRPALLPLLALAVVIGVGLGTVRPQSSDVHPELQALCDRGLQSGLMTRCELRRYGGTTLADGTELQDYVAAVESPFGSQEFPLTVALRDGQVVSVE